MIVLSQLLGLFSISLDALGAFINEYVSSEAADILYDFISYSPTGAMNVFLILTALWSASRAQFSMMRIANYTITSGRVTGRGYFRDRFRAVRTILFTLFTVTCSLIILVYGELLLKIIVSGITQTLHIDYEPGTFWLFIRWPIVVALYFLMVSYNYYILPYEKVEFKSILPGSIFASIAMLLVTLIYTKYTKYIANYDIIYGSLASVVALLFWFFFLSWTIWLGVLFNKVWADTAGTKEID
jgi:membrane protein